jgi:two-component system, OmpR family, response regulator
MSAGYDLAMRVLVVEDEVKLAKAIREALRADGQLADVAITGEDALWMAGSTPYDVVCLDVNLPGIDGFETCQRLRADGVRTPILMLTARDAVADRVTGLQAGADDYLVKPFAVPELIARLRALMRRHGDSASQPLLSYADLTLDVDARRATRGGRAIALTGRETALLELLLREPARTITRERALEEIWDDAAEANVVDRYVTRLRRKLGPPPLIRTLRGTGFELRA